MKVGIVNAATHNPPIMLEVFPSADIGTLKSMIEVELHIPYVRQSLSVPGKYHENVIRDQDTLEGLRLAQGEIILVADRGVPGGSPMQPVADELFARSTHERGFLAKLKEKQPELAVAVENRDIKAATSALTNLFNRKKNRPVAQACNKETASPSLAGSSSPPAVPVTFVQTVPYYVVQPYYYDPNVPAMHPSLLQVQKSLLYVGVSINGVPVNAFVDCAAQASTISENFARQCNLLGSIDSRFRGYAGGPESPQIIGRLHHIEIAFRNGPTCGSALSVLQNPLASDLVLGLDFFKRHLCCIDMRYNCLRIGETGAVPFLTPDEIQRSVNDDILKSLLDQPPTEFGGSVIRQSARSSAYNFTLDSQPANGNFRPPQFASSSVESYTPLGSTHQAKLSPPAQPQPLVWSADTHPRPEQPKHDHPRPPAAAETRTTDPRRPDQELELNVNRSRRIHQQAFDEKNVGGRLIEETKIKQLVDLGFEQRPAQEALRKCKGDTELAAALLFQSNAKV